MLSNTSTEDLQEPLLAASASAQPPVEEETKQGKLTSDLQNMSPPLGFVFSKEEESSSEGEKSLSEEEEEEEEEEEIDVEAAARNEKAKNESLELSAMPLATPAKTAGVTWRVASGVWSWTRFGISEGAGFLGSLASIGTVSSIAWRVGGSYYGPMAINVATTAIFPAATVPMNLFTTLNLVNAMSIAPVSLIAANKGAASKYYKAGKETAKEWFRTTFNFEKKAPADTATLREKAVWQVKDKVSEVLSLFPGAAYTFAGVVSLRAVSMGALRILTGQPLAAPMADIAEDLAGAAAFTATVLVGKEGVEFVGKTGDATAKAVADYALDRVEDLAEGTYNIAAAAGSMGYDGVSAFGSAVATPLTWLRSSKPASPVSKTETPENGTETSLSSVAKSQVEVIKRSTLTLG